MALFEQTRRITGEMKMKKRLLGILLSFALMMVMMPTLGMTQTAYADDTIWYVNENGDRVETRDYVPVNDSTTEFVDGYKVNVVEGNVKLNGPFTVNGNAKLVLYDGAELTIEGVGKNDNALEVTGGTLTVYAQSNGKGMGKLSAEGVNGISITSAGTLNVVGGEVTAKGLGDAEYGIDGTGGSISVKGGVVKADGDSGGIAAKDLEITGGIVTAEGGTYGIGASNSLTISDGTVTANATDDSGQAIDASGTLSIGNDVFVMAGESEASAQIVSDTDSWQHNERWVRTAPLYKYDLWVGGVQVTNANQDDVLRDDTKNKGKVSFDPDTYTLTLNGATITTGYIAGSGRTNGIYYDENNPLTIDLQSGSVNSISNVDNCIYSEHYSAALTISGSGTLNASSESYYGVGIFAYDALTIKDCTVAVVMGGNDAKAILAETNSGVITIDGASVNASAPGASAFGIRSLSAYVDIKSRSRVTAVGGIQGIGGNVKNHIAGLGWTNTEGTEGEKHFDINTEGRNLGDDIKRAEFLAPEASVTKVPEAKNLTYNGSAQKLVTAGEADGGEMQYALGIDNKTAPAEGWSTSIPAGTDVGDYYVWYKAVGDNTHIDSDPACVKSTIVKKPEPTPTPTPAKTSGTPTAKVTTTKKSMTLGWNKIEGADGYDIFFAECNHGGKKIVCKNVKNIKGNNVFTWKKSGLKKGTAYKSYVKAYVMHAYTGNGTKKYTNAKSVTLKNVKKGKVSLKKGKTFKIKAKVNKVKKNKKLMPKGHAPKLRYLTSDSKVATVNAKGKITAKGSGTCTVTVFAHNGVSKSIKVTVK